VRVVHIFHLVVRVVTFFVRAAVTLALYAIVPDDGTR
jgi:hypothetical protein